VEGRDSDITAVVETALREDTAWNDPTTALLVGKGTRGRAVIRARTAGVVSGQRCARTAFALLDRSISYGIDAPDGSSIRGGGTVATVEGTLGPILGGERTALNFLQHLSGIATSVRRFVERIEGTGAVILDTRKTTPGMRLLEKEAVLHGGGRNHRMNLAGLVLVKENHIAAAGGLERVIELLGADMGKAEIEITSLDELRMLRGARPARIMLDNFTPEEAEEAMEELKGWEDRPEIEVSGGVTIETVRSYALLGVDFISIGSITASARALDMSLVVDGVE